MKLDPPAVALIAPARVPPANSTATPQISMQPNLAVKPRMRLANMFWLECDARSNLRQRLSMKRNLLEWPQSRG